MTKLVRWQLIIFVVVAVLGIVYVGAKYVRLDRMLGFGQYKVQLQMARTGGVFTNAEVAYRGVPVGRVGEMRLTRDGVEATLLLDSGKSKIPASAKAIVANRSAIGEQYVDLQPDADSGPYLHEGSVLQTASVPPKIDELLHSVDTFAHTVPLEDLRTTVTELGKAFDGNGDDLQVIVQSLNSFTKTWDESLPQTLKLITDGRRALDTQAAQAGSIRTFGDGLDKLAAQLKASDPDLRRLIDTGTPASEQFAQLLYESGPALTTDLANLRSVGKVLGRKGWTVTPLLQMLPALSLGPSSTAPGDGTTHFGTVLEVNSPPPCTQGYEGTKQILAQMKARNPGFDDTRDDFPFNVNAKCTVPQGSPTDVRGGERAELADPAVRQPWDNKPKTMPDVLNLQPLNTQMAVLLGVTPKR